MGTKTQQNDKWSNCRLAKTTMKRLDQHGVYKTANTYDKIVVKLNIVEGKDFEGKR
jgi:hypothetical protein